MKRSNRVILISFVIAAAASAIFFTIHFPRTLNCTHYDSFVLMAQMGIVFYTLFLGLLTFIAVMSILFAIVSLKAKYNTFIRMSLFGILLCVFIFSGYRALSIVSQSAGWYAKDDDYTHPHPDKAEPPISINGPVEFEIAQNSTMAIPDSNDRVMFTTGPIARGQIIASLAWSDGYLITNSRSLRKHSHLSFFAEGHGYLVELKEITEPAAGENTARFEVSPVEKSVLSAENKGYAHKGDRKMDPLLQNVKRISTGSSSHHTLALRSDGSIAAWGSNQFGQIDVPLGHGYIDIAAGNGHSLALKADGTIVGWGYNYWGQTEPPDGNDFVAIAACSDYSLALTADGSIIGWGTNQFGQIDVPQGNDYTAVSAGWLHALALKKDGTIVQWGSEGDKELKPDGNHFTAIAAGRDYSLALKADGSIVGWGFDLARSKLPAHHSFIAISTGVDQRLALKNDGTVVGWGDNKYGLAAPPEGNNFIAIGTGWAHSVALKADGTVVEWGAKWLVGK